MLHRRTILPTGLFLLSCAAAPLASAQPGERGGMRPPPPPQEATEACEGKQENTACSFIGRRNNLMEGICISPPGLESLVCAPEGGPPAGPSRSDGN